MTETFTADDNPRQYFSLKFMVEESLCPAIEEALIGAGFQLTFDWKPVRSMSPNFGETDKKAKYRANETARRVAAMYGVSHAMVSLAHRVVLNAPELLDQLRDGQITLQDAVRQLKREGRFKTVRELRSESERVESIG